MEEQIIPFALIARKSIRLQSFQTSAGESGLRSENQQRSSKPYSLDFNFNAYQETKELMLPKKKAVAVGVAVALEIKARKTELLLEQYLLNEPHKGKRNKKGKFKKDWQK